MNTCQACGNEYPFSKSNIGRGASPVLCPNCQERLKQVGVGNLNRRPLGHRTRQQHKKVGKRR